MRQQFLSDDLQPEPSSTMKALTICQPFAELIARGEKRVENRTWATNYRGPIAIHAGKSRAWIGAAEWERFDVDELTFGAIVAVAELVDCCRVEDLERHGLAGHEHAHGPWCWVLKNVRRLPEPVPMSGRQSLWTCELPS